ncbi:MAG: 23S rRNA (adenine(2503)-C(2))-methyltransferase RlmN [Flavobacteriaceae bacterium]|nr:23S rRNA (adenine(2503)-C(2))-methyltransferase RlmN [Flavobacteriaceae bacterium]|tara:strand:- start:828 stop:1868 length:1041 start_codon:yes stop_codon:yes gene_type:complete
MNKIKKKDIRSFSLKKLEIFFQSIGEEVFRAKQVYKWLWQKGVPSFEKMTNIPKSLRVSLNENFFINNILIYKQQKSKDGTIKNSVKLHDGLIVESVIIPSKKRITACVSSQVGCSLDCSFCATSLLKRMRNLNSDEIFDQVVSISKQSKIYLNRPLTNIVFMGMGEPLLNYKNVIEAIKKITSNDGLGLSPRRITLSTSGIPKMIKKLADDRVKFKLAVSLHSARQSIREKIMPFSKNFPIEDLIESLKYWNNITNKVLTLEYIVWEGINDKVEDINSLIDFCKEVPSKVNLIQYNSIGNLKFKRASKEKVIEYKNSLEEVKIPVSIRISRGKDIDAACGQLANK